MRLISVCVFIFCVIQSGFCDGCDDIIVEVQQGLLRGEIVNAVVENKPYYSFKGIPYAKPPVGALRFKAPQEPEKWDGVRDATAHGNVCPQLNSITGEFTPGNEDCLFLNVYSPNITQKSPLPVFFFIHGGAYQFGSGNMDLYGPDFLVTEDVVTVTLNYRLAMLGFLSLDIEEVPGNAGLKDQVAALKWVHNNIDKFGGDPNSVTIVGDTAGGHSVTLHLLSPMSKGLFKRAVAMSGASTCDFALSYQPQRKALLLGELLGLETQNTTKLLELLQSVDYTKFFDITPTVLSFEEKNAVLFKMQHFTPMVEKDFGNNFLTEDPNVLLKSGKVNQADVMVGHSSQEAILLIDLFNVSYILDYKRNPEMFVPSVMLMKCTPDTILEVSDKVKDYYFGSKPVTSDNIDIFVRYSSSASINNHVQRFARKWSELGLNTYFFVMSYYSSLNTYGQQGAKYGLKQAAHFDFPFYLFNPVSLNRTVSADSTEYQMIQNITTAITNFAKTSDPSVDGNVWPLYDNSSLSYMNFGNDGLIVKSGPEADDFNFWKNIYESNGVDY